MTRVLYSGSFDPITKGHMDIIRQAREIFDELVVAIMQNPQKKASFFTDEERLSMIKELYKDDPHIKVVIGASSAVDEAINNDCKAIIRGLRSLKDFDYESLLQQINKEISNGRVNTVCFFAEKNYQFISSSVVKEVFRLNKDISDYVDPLIQKNMCLKADKNE